MSNILPKKQSLKCHSFLLQDHSDTMSFNA